MTDCSQFVIGRKPNELIINKCFLGLCFRYRSKYVQTEQGQRNQGGGGRFDSGTKTRNVEQKSGIFAGRHRFCGGFGQRMAIPVHLLSKWWR